jgi:hypothetical protein
MLTEIEFCCVVRCTTLPFSKFLTANQHYGHRVLEMGTIVKIGKYLVSTDRGRAEREWPFDGWRSKSPRQVTERSPQMLRVPRSLTCPASAMPAIMPKLLLHGRCRLFGANELSGVSRWLVIAPPACEKPVPKA